MSQKLKAQIIFFFLILILALVPTSLFYNNFVPSKYSIYIGLIISICLTSFTIFSVRKQHQSSFTTIAMINEEKPIKGFISFYLVLPFLMLFFLWQLFSISIPMTLNYAIGNTNNSNGTVKVLFTSSRTCKSQYELELGTWTPLSFRYCMHKNTNSVIVNKKYTVKIQVVQSVLGSYVRNINYNGVDL
jgi:hypothetical protein